MARKDKEKILHHSVMRYRLNHDPQAIETTFAELWEEENTPRAGRRYTILQALLSKHVTTPGGWHTDRLEPIYEINQRDAHIAATVIQWLGTNVGFAFLCRVLNKAGYELRRTKDGLK